MEMDWTSIILSVLTILSAVITGFVIPWLNEKIKTSKVDNLNAYLKILMSAAESYFGSEQGEKKKAWVLAQLKKYVSFDEETINDALESMWRELSAQGILNTEDETYLTDEELEG